MASASASAAAAAARRSFGTRLKVNEQSVAFVRTKAGLGIPEDIYRKEGHFQKLKKWMSQSWENLPERVQGMILEQAIKSVFVTTYAAGFFAVSTTLEKLGIVDTGLSSMLKQKEHITAVVKAENRKMLEELKNHYDEDKAELKRLSEQFETHRALTRLWLAHLIEKSLDPLDNNDICIIQEVFSKGSISLEEAHSVMQKLGKNVSKSQLQQLMAERGKISLPDLLGFLSVKEKGRQSEPEPNSVAAEDHGKAPKSV